MNVADSTHATANAGLPSPLNCMTSIETAECGAGRELVENGPCAQQIDKGPCALNVAMGLHALTDVNGPCAHQKQGQDLWANHDHDIQNYGPSAQISGGLNAQGGNDKGPRALINVNIGLCAQHDETVTLPLRLFANHVEHTDMMFVFPAKVSAEPCKALMDTGASHSIVSEDFVKSVGLRVQPSRVKAVDLADGRTLPLAGKCTFKMHLNGKSSKVSAHVLSTTVPGVDVILGQDWLRPRCAQLDCNTGSVTLRYATGVQVLHGRTIAEQVVGYVASMAAMCCPTVPLLTLRGLKRMLQQPDTTVKLLMVKSVDDLVSEGGVCDDPSLMPAASVQRLLHEFKDVFQEPPAGMPKDRGIDHTIPLNLGAKPYYRRPYRLSPAEDAEARRQIADLLAKGWIEPSASPWGAPILFVRKKSGELRMCVDYRGLNQLTVKDGYPMPRVEDLFDRLQGATVYSSLDMASGYHQVAVEPSQRHLTSFVLPWGQFAYRVMPFGLTGAVATFNRLMHKVFQPLLNKCVLCFLDDILVFSKSPEEHEQHLREVLTILRHERLYCKLSKCEFNRSELRYLGHIVGRDGVKVDPDKCVVIRDWPVPTNVKEVQRFLGLANYYRKFVKNYSTIAAPLTDLTGKHSTWQWGHTQQTAFLALKAALSSAPVLAYPDFGKPFELYADASIHGTGAILSQNGHPIAYYSHKFTPAEVNYTTSDQELLALVLALKHWRCYLEGSSVHLLTDHNPITTLKTLPLLSRRQARWLEYMSGRFDFTIQHIPGKTNPADAISRAVPVDMDPDATLPSDDLPVALAVVASAVLRVDNPVVQRVVEASKLPAAQREASRLRCVYDPGRGLFMLGNRVFVPDVGKLRHDVIMELHATPSGGHVGRDKTVDLLHRSFYWPGQYSDVVGIVSRCDVCQRIKPSTQAPAGLMQPLHVPSRKWQSISMDFVVGLPRTKKQHNAIWVVVDRLTKMVHLVPIKDTISAEDLAYLFVEHVYRLHGLPEEIISDRDSKFTSVFWAEVCDLLGIKRAMSTAFHAQTDGQTERTIRTLQCMLRAYVTPDQKNWDRLLACAEFAINNSWQKSVQNTPFMLNYGEHPASHVTISVTPKTPAFEVFSAELQAALQRAKKCLQAAQDRQKTYYDQGRRDLSFANGDQVLLSTANLRPAKGVARKLLPRWVGPFSVVRMIGPVAAELELPAGWKIHNVFHVSLLKPYKHDGNVQPPEVMTFDLSDASGLEVERILDHRPCKSGGKKWTEYLCKWSDQPVSRATWEHEDQLHAYTELLELYARSVPNNAPVVKEPPTKPVVTIHGMDDFDSDSDDADEDGVVASVQIVAGPRLKVALVWALARTLSARGW